MELNVKHVKVSRPYIVELRLQQFLTYVPFYKMFLKYERKLLSQNENTIVGLDIVKPVRYSKRHKCLFPRRCNNCSWTILQSESWASELNKETVEVTAQSTYTLCAWTSLVTSPGKLLNLELQAQQQLSVWTTKLGTSFH